MASAAGPARALRLPGEVFEWETAGTGDAALPAPAVPRPTACACGGGCPRCSGPPRRVGAERSAQDAVAGLAARASDVRRLAQLLGDRGLPPGPVGAAVRATLQPHTGVLPPDLVLRTGPDVDRVLAASGARGLARGRELWVGGPRLAPGAGGFASVLVHEARHVAAGDSLAGEPPHLDLAEPLEGSWYEAERARIEALEAAETGPGRQATLERLAGMDSAQARQLAPGIAFRAQARGDVELAVAAAERLLRAWLDSAEVPSTLSAAFGPEDAVDALLAHAETAFDDGAARLGGAYLGGAMVQLVRAAHAAVARRPPPAADPRLAPLHEALLVLQRGAESEIRDRLQRARELLRRRAVDAAAGGAEALTQFEAAATAVERAEQQAGPPIAEDLGSGGAVPRPTAARAARRAAELPPARPQPAPRTVVSRAAEAVVNERHPQLEGALVWVHNTPMAYGNVLSPRHGVAGTLQGARQLAAQIFGLRSAVIAEDTQALDAAGGRQVRYVVAALDHQLQPVESAAGEAGAAVPVPDYELLPGPASRRYFFLGVVTGDWLFFAPRLRAYLARVAAGERDSVAAPAAFDEERRRGVFGPLDALIEAGRTQDAADELAGIGAAGFALVDAATKARYVATLLDAVTLHEHERAVVEVFRAVTGVDELRAILHELQRRGLLHNLHADLQSEFPSLLLTLGQRFGGGSLTSDQVWRLLSEVGIGQVLPGIELRADGSITLVPGLESQFVAALEGLFDMIAGAVTGIVGIVADPESFVKGIGRLLYFAGMAELARYGHPGAQRYVAEAVRRLAQTLGLAMRGLSALQQNVPAGAGFVRDLELSVQWRLVWEVLGLFIGVGEVVAFVDAVRGGRASAALAELAAGLGRLGRAAGALEEGAAGARLLRLASAVEGRAATQQAHLLAVLQRLPEAEQARLLRLVGEAEDVARLGDEARGALTALRADADALAELQQHLGDLAGATALWERLAAMRFDGPAVSRLLARLPEDAALRARALRAIDAVAQVRGAGPALVEAVASSAGRVEAVEHLGAARYAALWERAGGDATRADAMLARLNERRGTDPVAWQRTLDELRDPASPLWRELEEAAGPAARGGATGEGLAVRELEHGARLRRGPEGGRRLCINPCADLDHLGLSDDVIDAAVRNLPAQQTRALVETLAAFRGERDVAHVQALVNRLARGGDEARAAAELLDRIGELRRIEGMQFELAELVAAYERGDAILAHGPLQTPLFLEDMPWGGQAIGPYTIRNGQLSVLERAELRGRGLPESLRTLDFVIIQGEGGVHRMVVGRYHSGLSGGRPWVFGAGELRFDRQGRLVEINRLSGHYRPGPSNPDRVLQWMRDHGVVGERAVTTTPEIAP